MPTRATSETEAPARIRLVAGLGNPGPAYAGTRHNLGFMILDEFARRRGLGFRKEGQALRAAHAGVVLLKPQTFMNVSGSAVQAAMTRQRIRPQELLVVHDDLALPLGRLRFRFGGSAGGQRGVQDVIARAGKDFWRLKLGIGGTPEGWETSNWVLSRFRQDEQPLLRQVVTKAADALEHALERGPDSAANEFNGLVLV